MNTPIGALGITIEESGALAELQFRAEHFPFSDDPRFSPIVNELTEYFDGARKVFTMPLAPRGTPFQLAVWNELANIAYGETISYGQLAERIRNPKAVRAVGAANGANPIPIVLPCHRVIGANGSLTGYGGGLPIKQRLLALEQSQQPLLFTGS
jgi:methylated-DNA-[protein]-cysteine S-methyltransferase